MDATTRVERGTRPGQARRSRRTIAGLSVAAVVSAALMVVLFARLMAAGQAVAGDPVSPIVGHHAPSFSVTTWNGTVGQVIKLSQFAGKPVVVNFFGSWCAECAEEQPVMNAAWQKYKSQGVQFIGIAFWDKQQPATAYLEQQGVTYPCGPDPSGTAVVDYAVTGAPETAFISRSGIVVSKFIGPIDQNSLDHSVATVLAHA